GDLGFLRFENNCYNLWAVKATGGEQRKLTTDDMLFSGFSGLPYDRRQTRDYSWSPDGGKVAYCSIKSGPVNVQVIAVDDSSVTRISDNTDPKRMLFCPTWSPDGTRIAYVSRSNAPAADGRNVESVWVAESGKSEILFQSDTPLRLIGWSESGDGIIVAVVNDASKQHPATAQVDLLEVSGGAGGSRKITSFPSAYLNSLRPSPDRRGVAFVARPDLRDNIWVFPGGGGKARKVTKNTDSRLYFSGLAWSPDGRAIYCSKLSSWSLISMIDNFRRKDLVSWQRPQNRAE
ncbi:MAG TPA: hypothetical protein VNI02_25610, partial [Blastocatellia bacterium]|nr:hypothetical protein [Blastocatellia bacterium]